MKSAELHNFSDASNVGYGQCSYLCLQNAEKARVRVLKTVSVPRSELTAALVSAKVNDEVKRELDFEVTKEMFWTDSQIALAYISNDSKRFHACVANRVSQIRSKSTKEQWKYVESSSNPADDGS